MGNLSLSEQISYSTIRIEAMTALGVVSGTGFFFNFLDDNPEKSYIPCIVTNKHVINDAINGVLVFTCKQEDGTEFLHRINITEFKRVWIFHPDYEIDLCVMPIAYVVNILNQKGLSPFWIPLNKTLIPNFEQLKELSQTEELFMIGYPNGIWDDINNKPIFRKGITATHPGLDFKGKKEFLIDAACFPGSSGSPVMVINPGGHFTKEGSLNFSGRRVYLLGVLYAGPQHTAHGEIKFVNIPNIYTPIPNNLGLEDDYLVMEQKVKSLKQQLWPGKKIILHSRDIRKCEKGFEILFDLKVKRVFYEGINIIMETCDYTIVACSILKEPYIRRYGKLSDVYSLSLSFIVERTVFLLDTIRSNQSEDIALHVIAEKRGRKEDNALLDYYNELLDRGTYFVTDKRIKNYSKTFQFRAKAENIVGLQVADLVAYPLTRHVLDKDAVNLAYDIIERKLYRQKGKIHGLKIHPKEKA